MADLYFKEMLEGESTQSKKAKKDRFDLAIERHINEYVDTLPIASFCNKNGGNYDLISRRNREGQLKGGWLYAQSGNSSSKNLLLCKTE